MTKTPLLQSRRFWTALLDALISITLFVVSNYLSPQDQSTVKFIVLTLQPVILALIISYTTETVALIRYSQDKTQ